MSASLFKVKLLLVEIAHIPTDSFFSLNLFALFFSAYYFFWLSANATNILLVMLLK